MLCRHSRRAQRGQDAVGDRDWLLLISPEIAISQRKMCFGLQISKGRVSLQRNGSTGDREKG